jgi:hypothetical protein
MSNKFVRLCIEQFDALSIKIRKKMKDFYTKKKDKFLQFNTKSRMQKKNEIVKLLPINPQNA